MHSSEALGGGDLNERAGALVGGQRATVLGLAREGLDLARFLARHGARVTVADRRPREQLAEAVARLEGLPIGFSLGDDSAPGLLECDVVYASPGVPPEHPLLAGARALGIATTSLVQLFFELCPAPIVGITGSAGKTTTTSLVGEMFREAGRQVFVGGNIGRPLLGELEQMTPQSWVVMELSSFQLEPMRRSPQVATVTNVTPNHLDRHANMEEYWQAKGQILAHQAPTDWAVLNADDAWSRRYAPRGRVLRFSLEGTVEGAYLAGSELMLFGEPLLRVDELQLRGRHNWANVLAAAATAHAAGVGREAMVAAARAFRGVPHRLEVVAERGGVRYVNDSIATSPERSIAALHAFEEPVVLLAGGRDKHLPMDEWARLIGQRARHVVLFGEMADLVARALDAAGVSVPTSRAATVREAVEQAAAVARSGDVVLLSPGGTSYDMYRDFEERGADFARAVREVAAAQGSAIGGQGTARPETSGE